ncbi:hypothetical protein TNCT_445301 [Trichonephila clavata]|uniref:Uncharacterized protein n=1 Tax=Trichonephila clavata TaxID=2740835 RepID=A0A8X6G5X1_TRICU|nr:hypothetical protein TNCT_445301 [Trichonephila clavata]
MMQEDDESDHKIGSQNFCTGQAKAIAEEIADKAPSYGPKGNYTFGIETGVDPWIYNLFATLQKFFGVEPTSNNISALDLLKTNESVKSSNMFLIESLSEKKNRKFSN